MFADKFLKLYPPDSANDLKKKVLYWIDGYKKQKEDNCPNTGDYCNDLKRGEENTYQ